MALTENLSLFLADFGVTVTSGAVTGLGILDMPGQVVAGDMIITTDYRLTAKTSEFGGLVYGAAVTVDAVNYQVRENRLIEDGKFCEITLLKVAPDSSAVGQDPRTFSLDDLADVDVTGAEDGDVLVRQNGTWVDGQDDNGTAVAVALS